MDTNTDLIRHIRTNGKFQINLNEIVKHRGELRGSALGLKSYKSDRNFHVHDGF